MEIITLTNYLPSLQKQINCFAVRLIQSKEIWLFNCTEGCQHILIKKNLKINHITTIILCELYIENISGLIGLLSSLNLFGRTQDIHIYSLESIDSYLDLAKKYSQTNFKYNIYTHQLKTGLSIKKHNYKLYTYVDGYLLTFLFITKEKNGQFKLKKALTFNLIQGPLYGKLKSNHFFILPDGTIIRGNRFRNNNIAGRSISLIKGKYHKRDLREIS